MQNLNVRRAISYALDRAALITDAGGPTVSPPLTQLLPPGVPGTSNFDLYPYNPAKAKALLGGKHYTFKFLYQINNPVQVKIFQTIQYELSAVGITVTGEGVPRRTSTSSTTRRRPPASRESGTSASASGSRTGTATTPHRS